MYPVNKKSFREAVNQSRRKIKTIEIALYPVFLGKVTQGDGTE